MWLAIGVVSATTGSAAAPAGVDSPGELAEPSRTLEVFQQSLPGTPVRLGGWSSSHERNHAGVKSAFRDVVRTASQSTVQVLCDGQPKALGTITHADGYLLTKHSELTGKNIICRFKDGRRLPARIVGVHRETDLAMLRVSGGQLKPVQFSEKEPPVVGSWLASPGLTESPVAIGIVSAPIRRRPAPFGVLGVMLGDAEAGPRVDDVLPGSAAKAAGVKAGDVIVRVNDTPTADRRALVATIRGHHPGEVVLLQVLRGDDEEAIMARLRDRADDAPPGSLEHQNRMGGRLSLRRTGFPQILQHDSVLRPHECGGPIVDLDGRVVGVNIARSGRVASLTLPAAVVTDLLDDMKSGKWPPPDWDVRVWDSRLRQLGWQIASLEDSLREAEGVRQRAHHRLLQSETAVRQALVQRAAAELRKVDAQQDVIKRTQAEAERAAAERAVERSAGPFEEAQKEVAAADDAIKELRVALDAARRERSSLAKSEND
jgi:serine protease Do